MAIDVLAELRGIHARMEDMKDVSPISIYANLEHAMLHIYAAIEKVEEEQDDG